MCRSSLWKFSKISPCEITLDPSMANLEFVREFAVPPREIFVFFVPQRMALWYGTEMNSCFEVQGGASDFAAGQKVRITGRLGDCGVGLTVVIPEYQRGSVLEW